MQQLFTEATHAGTDLLDHVRPGPAPLATAEYPPPWSVRQQLLEACLLAGDGEVQKARMLCAEVVLDHLFELASDRELLRLAIATLIHARGFQLLGRLLLAVDGRRIRVSVGAPIAGSASPPHLIGRSDADGVTTFTVNERLFGDPARAAVIDRWSAELARGQERRSAAATA